MSEVLYLASGALYIWYRHCDVQIQSLWHSFTNLGLPTYTMYHFYELAFIWWTAKTFLDLQLKLAWFPQILNNATLKQPAPSSQRSWWRCLQHLIWLVMRKLKLLRLSMTLWWNVLFNWRAYLQTQWCKHGNVIVRDLSLWIACVCMMSVCSSVMHGCTLQMWIWCIYILSPYFTCMFFGLACTNNGGFWGHWQDREKHV